MPLDYTVRFFGHSCAVCVSHVRRIFSRCICNLLYFLNVHFQIYSRILPLIFLMICRLMCLKIFSEVCILFIRMYSKITADWIDYDIGYGEGVGYGELVSGMHFCCLCVGKFEYLQMSLAFMKWMRIFSLLILTAFVE